VRRGSARTVARRENTISTYLHIEQALILGAGIIGIAFLAVSVWWDET
jgi:hypothetical protein